MIFAADLPADDSDIDLPQGIRKPFSDDCFSHPATVQGVPGLGVIWGRQWNELHSFIKFCSFLEL